jgi:hypothetical protein
VTSSAPPQDAAARFPLRPPHLPRHRLLVLLIVVLLIALPAGYLVLSAFQSRAGGRSSQQRAAVSDLTWEWPSKVKRRIYDVPIPVHASYVAYYETNSLHTSRLYVQFRTSDKRLGNFLRHVGLERSDLHDGKVTISAARADDVGWDLRDPAHTYAGVARPEPGAKPDLSITVDTTPQERPRVFVVSTVEF